MDNNLVKNMSEIVKFENWYLIILQLLILMP